MSHSGKMLTSGHHPTSPTYGLKPTLHIILLECKAARCSTGTAAKRTSWHYVHRLRLSLAPNALMIASRIGPKFSASTSRIRTCKLSLLEPPSSPRSARKHVPPPARLLASQYPAWPWRHPGRPGLVPVTPDQLDPSASHVRHASRRPPSADPAAQHCFALGESHVWTEEAQSHRHRACRRPALSFCTAGKACYPPGRFTASFSSVSATMRTRSQRRHALLGRHC